MLSKKYIITLYAVIFCVNVYANNNSDQENRVISITKCKKVECGLILNQEGATQEEREEALNLISTFCNNELNNLSEQLKQKTPNVSITIVLVNIEEDENTQQEAANPIDQDQNAYSTVDETAEDVLEDTDNTSSQEEYTYYYENTVN
ncbi:hypothetical protein EKK58_01870 [Candidatus Dependentiae bacterium]|nr:MAG: hypothetical protein EKK58_01870 [Candidatus Dependentiae bacterium]